MKIPAVLRLGFRPFFLGATLFSCVAILLWLVALGNGTPFIGSPHLLSVQWHSHEMMFGFVFAIIAGFLLTATKHWTGYTPAQGGILGVMVAFWLIARFCLYFGAIEAACVFDLVFSLMFVGAIARVLIKAKMWRNLLILNLLIALTGLNAWFYADIILGLKSNPFLPVELALGISMLLVIIITGRIMPMFSQNAVPGLKVVNIKAVSIASPLSATVAFLGWFFLPPMIATVLCVLAIISNTVRWVLWKPWASWSNPMFWILLVGYIWIPITYALMILEMFGFVPRSMPVHTMAIGAIGMPIIGMMARVSRGHTGHPVIADWLEKVMFYLVCLSAVLRAVAACPEIQQSVYENTFLMTSGTAWIIAFGAFALRYGPWLLRQRADGAWG